MSSLPRIHALPDLVIDQIAAGEVIERPASVLKELIENSLDAGAQRLVIEIEDAGLRLVRVRDDGLGMHPEDLVLALRRHCTSKIGSIADIETVATLGFRGEALPSIVAVAAVNVISRATGADCAARITAANGRVQRAEPAAHPQGTTVEVRDLFATVPARRRFLRSPRTELLHMQEVVRRAALARFDVALQVSIDGRSFLRLPAALTGEQRLRRVAAVLGAAFAARAIALERTAPGLALTGWLAHPDNARSTSDQQYLDLSGRPLRDPRLGHALRRAYEEWLQAGRYPAVVARLDVAPGAVDVNVHPTKAEVRFSDPRGVHDFLFGSVRSTLRSTLASSAGGAATDATSTPRSGDDAARPGLWQVSEPAPATPPALPSVHVLLADRYLICSTADAELMVFDMDRVERVLIAAAWRAARAGGAVPPKPLLLPVPLAVTPRQFACHGALRATLQELGFVLDGDSAAQLRLRAVPDCLRQVSAASLAHALQAIFTVSEEEAAGSNTADAIVERVIRASTSPRPGSLERSRARLAELHAQRLHPHPRGAPLQWRAGATELAALLAGSCSDAAD